MSANDIGVSGVHNSLMAFGALNRLFTERTLDALAKEGWHPSFNEAVREHLDSVNGLSNGEALSALYRHMVKCYRNEYVYKSFLLKKLVFGVHSPRTSTAICELPVASSVADFVIVNGRAVVYEVKTELDNLSRLDSQIADYYKAFKFVNVLCSESSAKGVLRKFEDGPVGVCVLTNRGSISKRKECEEYSSCLERPVQFDLLRKAERESVLLACGGSLPEAAPAMYYRACLRLIERIPDEDFNREYIKVLKGRGSSIDLEALEMYPEEFRLVAYTHRATKHQAEGLDSFLMAPCCV